MTEINTTPIFKISPKFPKFEKLEKKNILTFSVISMIKK